MNASAAPVPSREESMFEESASLTDEEPPKRRRYSYKASLAGSLQAFELTEPGMTFQTGFRSGLWRYADIARIRLTYRPVSMLRHRFRADVSHKDGKTLRIVSATWAGLVAMTPQDEAYRAFVEDLHRRVADRPGLVCVAGLPPLTFALAGIVFAAITIAIAALLVSALVTAQFAAALFLLGFMAWSGWYAGGWLIRNKPRSYAPQSVPRHLLP